VVYVVNTYGYGSFGDDSHVETLRQGLAQAWPLSQIVVNRMDAIPFSPDRQEAVVLGGGGILYRHTYEGGQDSLKHFLRYPAAAQKFGRKTLALGIGVQGPLKSSHIEGYVDVLNAMTLMTVRDSRSAEILHEAGVSAPVLESADLSYCVPLPERLPIENRSKPVLGVAASQPDKGVIYQESHGFEDRVLAALADLNRDFDVRFYMFDRRTDGTIPGKWEGSHFTSCYDPSVPDAVNGFVSAIGESDIFLTSRLHGVIFCARMGIPFVSIGASGEKVERESQSLGNPFHLPYSAGAGEIVDSMRNVWANRRRTVEAVAAAAAQRERLSRKTLEALHACN
jgi:polysaccharide pyruvyl transferase WcaK-like protein